MCVAKYLYEEGMINQKAKFISGDGEHKIRIINQDEFLVNLKMVQPKSVKSHTFAFFIYFVLFFL